jgi:DNA (cytosine-5)-methyltransferase 1
MNAVELFAGAGGLGMGISRAGFEPVAVVEWDKWACDTIRENAFARGALAKWPLTEGDVTQFDFKKIRESVALVSGGPPCQPFSLGGKHNGPLDKRDMFPQAVRAVRELQPRAFIFENVKGLTRTSFANYLEYIRLQLRHPEVISVADEQWTHHLSRLERHETAGKRSQGLQYNVVIRLLNAADYGVPQKRQRVFIVGFRSDLGLEWSFPEATHSDDALLWSKWRSGEYWDMNEVAKRKRPTEDRGKAQAARLRELPPLKAWQTVRDAFRDLPDPEKEPLLARGVKDHLFIPGARSYPGHTGSPLDEPAKTLKAGDHGVPGGENMLRRPDGSVRYFTVRESARLQAFPDQFKFHGSWSETMRQLGNAVPVRLAEAVAGSVRIQLDKAISALDAEPPPVHTRATRSARGVTTVQSTGPRKPSRKRSPSTPRKIAKSTRKR